MGSIIIHASKPKDLAFLQQLAMKMGFDAQILTDSEKEDFILAKAIEENDLADQLKMEEALAYYRGLDKSNK